MVGSGSGVKRKWWEEGMVESVNGDGRVGMLESVNDEGKVGMVES